MDEPLRYFLDAARTLGPKLGPMLFQLPRNFRKDLSRLGDLLARLLGDLRDAFGFRQPSSHADDLEHEESGIGPALASQLRALVAG